MFIGCGVILFSQIWVWIVKVNRIFRPINSHTFGTTLTHSRSISHSHAGGLKSHAFVSSRVMCPTGLPIVPAFEMFASYAEESNPKLLPPNAFPVLTVPQKYVGSRTQ